MLISFLISLPLLFVLDWFCPPLQEIAPIFGLGWGEAMGGMVGLIGFLCWVIDLG
jgi:hypothetical protein